MHNLNRRDFVKTTGALLGAAMLPALPRTATAANPTAGKDLLRVIQIGVGGIGGMDRGNIARHPKVKIVGLVDIDKNTLDKVGEKFPDAFRENDYRKVFADRLGEFDAVNVCTPDHSHIAPILHGLANNKHVYAQKPLVQQLEELDMLDRAFAARPHLATNTGNQRMSAAGRRVAVDILKRSLLGKAIDSHIWTSSSRGSANAKELPPEMAPPAHVDWDLFLGGAPQQPYRKGIHPNHWRSWWDFGTGALGDWGMHLLDVVMYGYPELTSPISVKTDTPRAADWYHTSKCKSTLTYAVNSDRFANSTFPIYYNDAGQMPDIAALNLPMKRLPANHTIVQCEGGVLVLSAGGKLQLFSKGKAITPADIGANEDVGEYKHWHNWVDRALGDTKAKIWTEFDIGTKITEAAILPGKASRYPGKELKWDRKKLAFTNSQEATDTVVRRTYRDGFAPPTFNKA